MSYDILTEDRRVSAITDEKKEKNWTMIHNQRKSDLRSW